MPHFKCGDCHHEYDDLCERECDWCGSDGPHLMLEEKTGLEQFIEDLNDRPMCSCGKDTYNPNFWDACYTCRNQEYWDGET